MWANHDVATQPFRKGAVDRPAFDKMADLLAGKYLKDPSYWKINGRACFSIYQPMTFINGLGGPLQARTALDSLRLKAWEAGVGPLHINLIDFELSRLPDALNPVRSLGADSVTSYVWIHDQATWDAMKFPTASYALIREKYWSTWDKWWKRSGIHFPNVTMGWDSTPRLRPDQKFGGPDPYPNAPVITGNTPAEFKLALSEARSRSLTLPPESRIVTINAWNEWTEGSYLEPDEWTGMAYLQAVKEVFGKG